MARVARIRRNQVYGVGSPIPQLFPDPIVSARAPSGVVGGDTALSGQMWVQDTGSALTDAVYILTGINAGVPNWQSLTGTTSITPATMTVSGAVTFSNADKLNGVLLTDGAGVVTGSNAALGSVLAGSGVGVTPAFAVLRSTDATVGIDSSVAGFINLRIPGAGTDWKETIIATYPMELNEGYIANWAGGGRLVYTLPVATVVGDVVRVIGKSTDLYDITQNAGDIIISSVGTTTAGVGHGIRNLGQYDIVELRYIGIVGADKAWVAYSVYGSLVVY